jgi:exopolysaccharide biosynthesis polyprenyl glycosylphosphotransferase
MKLQLKPREHRAVLIAGDLILTAVAVFLALGVWALRGGYALSAAFVLSRLYWFPVLIALWFALALLSDFHSVRLAGDWRRTLVGLLWITGLELGIYLLVYFFSPPQRLLPRGVVLYHGAFSLALVASWRAAYGFLARTTLRRRALIVGAGRAGQRIVRVIREAGTGFDLLGFVDDDPTKQGRTVAGLPVLGSHRDLVALTEDHSVSQIILAVTRDLSPQLYRALLACSERGAEITPMPLVYEELTGRVAIEHVGDNWLAVLPLDHAAVSGLFPLFKRGLDIVVALIGLAVFAIFFPFVALAAYVDSPGPIFYRQERVGQGGETFRVIKLRSMILNAERKGQAVWAVERDPRVTRVGRVLRATHFDELPQFFNILRGDMSVVGPRPERPEFVAQLEEMVPFYRLRHAVKPGMAGWALVNHGYSSSVEDARVKVQYDLYYIKHQSIYLDLLILFKTLADMVTFGGR